MMMRRLLLASLLALTGCPFSGSEDQDRVQAHPKACDPGKAGPRGPAGPPGILEAVHVLYDDVYVNEGLHETVTVFCPEGSLALSGGASMASVSIPEVRDGKPVGWTCGGDAWDGPVIVGCYAVCTGEAEESEDPQ